MVYLADVPDCELSPLVSWKQEEQQMSTRTLIGELYRVSLNVWNLWSRRDHPIVL